MPTLWVHVGYGPGHGPHVARWSFDAKAVSRLRALSEAVKALKAEELALAEGPDEWLCIDGRVPLVGDRLVVVPDGCWFEVREKHVDGHTETELVDISILEAALDGDRDVFVPDTENMKGLIVDLGLKEAA